MGNHRTEGFVDDEMSVPGHTALVAHNHSVGTQSLTCDDCAEALGSFPPGRWRERHLRGAWAKHLAERRARPDQRRAPGGYDPAPTILVGILSGPEAERAYDRYAADLDERVPGWWDDDETRMAPSLRNRALKRRSER